MKATQEESINRLSERLYPPNDPAGETSLYQRNLAVLTESHSEWATQIEKTPPDSRLSIAHSRSGHPVPVLDGVPFYSLDDPIAEGMQVAHQALGDSRQQRMVFFGFGFGYYLFPFVSWGLSPIVVEPSASLFKLALNHLDLTEVLPHLSLHLGCETPDIPRSTKLILDPLAARHYPREAAAVKAKIIDCYPEKTDDVEEGVYYESYRNVTCLKHPCDLAVYQMILHLVRPTLVIEIGTCRGGSALFFADILRTLGGNRQVYTYDLVDEAAPEVKRDPNISFHPGGWQAFDPSIVKSRDRVLVVEDSAHDYENTLAVLKNFAPYVTPNSYLIVEDGAAGLVRPQLNGGALRAIEELLQTHPEFEVDSHWESFFGSGNSNCLKGFLRRKPSPTGGAR